MQGLWAFDIYYSGWWPERISNPTLSRVKWRWLIKSNEIHWSGLKDSEVNLSFTIDPSKSPRQIDLTFVDGPHKGKVLQGIYHSSGKGTYQICFSDPDAKLKRPTDVSYSMNADRTMVVLKNI